MAVSSLINAVAITAGQAHTCALRADGTARCWGEGGSGRLGNGTTTDQFVSGITNATAIAAGAAHTCALRFNGTASCWGSNIQGQLGDGTTTDRPTPVAVSGLTNAVAIAAGFAHTCALLADGTVRCWGDGGRLGDGTDTDRLTPVAVSGLTNAVAIAAGHYHTCALLADGTARCWGNGFYGQLGDGTDVLRPTPVTVTSSDFQPGGLRGIVQLATGGDHTCARLANGGVRCWGRNSSGQIGDGRPSADRLRPVAVPSFTFNIDPTVELRGKKGEAIVNVIALCEEGDRLQVRVEVTQGSARGHGNDHFECTGITGKFPVSIHPQGNNTFVAGPAQAQAEADIKDQGPVDHQEWSRTVEIVSMP